MKNNTFLVLPFLLVACITCVCAVPSHYEYDYSDEDVKLPECDRSNCLRPNCTCFGNIPDVSPRPQFVMLTFDDAITVANIETYRKILKGRNIKMTFFVSHEYNDYFLTNEMYRQGHEIAVHSISHESNTDIWRDGNEEKWRRETVGMRVMLNTFGGIPEQELVGHRAPFLQTAGNTTFKVLKKEGFLYDSSMPTRSFMDPPIWPYTLDYGYRQDCQIQPCPTEDFKGVWEVPMIQYKRTDVKTGDFFCSMLDACTPQPLTETDTKDFLMKNFNRHYHSSRAPFPVFLHEAWLREPKRLAGFIQFFNEILAMEDVFAVSVRQVVEYMKNPVSARQFKARQQTSIGSCRNPDVCSYKEPQRIMKSCASGCPKYYPWVGTPLGKRPPKDFPSWE